MQMLSYIAIGLALALASADAQFTTVGSCSAETVAAVVAKIPGNDVCNMAGYRIVNAGNLGLSLDSITDDLASVCNGACGGTLSKFLSTCGTEGRSFAYLITISCLRRPDNSYCVEQLPNLLNTTNFMAAESCLTYTPGTLCPIGCAEPLRRVIDQMRCCYRPLYGNGDVKKRFPALYNGLIVTTLKLFSIC